MTFLTWNSCCPMYLKFWSMWRSNYHWAFHVGLCLSFFGHLKHLGERMLMKYVLTFIEMPCFTKPNTGFRQTCSMLLRRTDETLKWFTFLKNFVILLQVSSSSFCIRKIVESRLRKLGSTDWQDTKHDVTLQSGYGSGCGKSRGRGAWCDQSRTKGCRIICDW